MQNSTETPRAMPTQYIQNNAGRGWPDGIDSVEVEMFCEAVSFLRPRNNRSGANTMIPNGRRQLSKERANHPTISGAEVASNEAITFASERATARSSPC